MGNVGTGSGQGRRMYWNILLYSMGGVLFKPMAEWWHYTDVQQLVCLEHKRKEKGRKDLKDGCGHQSRRRASHSFSVPSEGGLTMKGALIDSYRIWQ